MAACAAEGPEADSPHVAAACCSHPDQSLPLLILAHFVALLVWGGSYRAAHFLAAAGWGPNSSGVGRIRVLSRKRFSHP